MLPYSHNKSLRVINIFGGPGTGKSTLGAGLFAKMKIAGMNVEYVSEVAKDYTWEGRHNMLTEQEVIFASQNNRLRRLVGQVEYAVVDSPLILGLMYCPQDFPQTFKPFILETFHTYTNVNVLLKRKFAYDPVGRNQTEEEAHQKDVELKLFLNSNHIGHIETEADGTICSRLMSMFK